jgi:hypothetical protein
MKLTPHQEELVQRVMAGMPPREAADGQTWQRIHATMGTPTREEAGTWGMWLETMAWVISYRPDLIPADSPLGKALERRGLDCRVYERIGRSVAAAVKEATR